MCCFVRRRAAALLCSEIAVLLDGEECRVLAPEIGEVFAPGKPVIAVV